jgi:hypothetical protein
VTPLDLTKLKSFSPLFPMIIHKYQDLVPDQDATILDKVNSIIQSLNQVGKLTNDVVKDWNTVYQWAMNDGLTQNVSDKLEDMLAKGEFDSLIATIVALVGDVTQLTTTDKSTIVGAVNELESTKANQTDLTATNNNIGDLTTLQTADKDSIVHAINDNVQSLTQIPSQSYITEKAKLASVKQNIGTKKNISFNTYWTDSVSPATSTTAMSQVDKMLPLSDSIVHAQYCDYNATTHTATYRGDMNAITSGINYAISNGMTFKSLKVHLKLSDIINDVGISSAITTYFNFVQSLLSNFTNKPEYVEIMNEDYVAYTNASYASNIASLLGQIKALGYKVSIPIRTVYELYTLNSTIINACDVLSVNLYPIYSIHYKDTTVEQCQCAFDQYSHYFRYLKNVYGKDIIISEVGCCSSWDAIENPATFFTTNPSGLPPYLVLKSLFNSNLINYVKEVWLWYYVDMYNSTEASNLLQSYKLSGNVRG